MNQPDESILLAGAPPPVAELLRQAGYNVLEADSESAALEYVRAGSVTVVLAGGEPAWPLLNSIKQLVLAPRLIVLAADAAGKIQALDQHADDAIAEPYDPAELLARVRSQVRAHRAEYDLRSQAKLAQDGFQVAQTAFNALAVTEKMTSDAFSLQRLLKYTAYGLLGAALVLAIVFSIFTGGEHRETQRAYRTIAALEKRLSRVRGAEPSIAEATGEARARGVIQAFTPSVCLLHVVVAFRDRETGKRLRIDPSGPAADDPKNEPRYTLEGRGPEVHMDFFGTGFLVAAGGRILTNHHVAEPWWENEEIKEAEKEGLTPVAVEMSAYFPNDPHPYRVRTARISTQVDLALMEVQPGGPPEELADLAKRAIPALDGSAAAAEGGDAVVLIGYPTGLDAILARTSETAAQSILDSNASSHQVLVELAKRKLIRPIVTQGHIGDVVNDRIVYDAQTTSGGSGGPLFNSQGKVVAVNYAVLAGFGGSNFGIPIRYAEELLKPPSAQQP